MSQSDARKARKPPADAAPAVPALDLGLALRERALAELLAAQDQLACQGADRHEGIHQARRHLRRTRAILALGTPGLGKRAAALSARIGSLCRGLSAIRDAQALLEALHRLDPEPADIQAILPDALAAAERQRDASLARLLARDPDLAARRNRIAGFRRRIERLDWTQVTRHAVATAMARSLRRMHKAERRARQTRQDGKAWHRFRRRLRRIHQQNGVLASLAPELRLKAKAITRQAQALGEAQDYLLLLARCRNRSPFSPGQRPPLRRQARQRLERIQRERP